LKHHKSLKKTFKAQKNIDKTRVMLNKTQLNVKIIWGTFFFFL